MREIRFRGKKNNGTWCYGYLLHDGQRGRYVITDGLLDINAVDIETVGQFTGLKDDDGADMYEGDIIRVTFNRNCYIGVQNAQFAIFTADNNLLGYFRGNAPHRKVIGNIYDNPELLKEDSV